MKTYIIQARVTALSSISHNGGETNGIVTQLRREKFVNGNKVVNVPLISGNSIRGKMRDLSAIEILTKVDSGMKIKVDLDSHNLLFSGGSLESTGERHLDLEKVRKMRKDIPIVSVFGCSIGNIILPGKVQIGKMYPICKELSSFIPDEFKEGKELKSVWDLCQTEMYNRTDDAKNEHYRDFLTDEAKAADKIKTQMKYHIETIIAGTEFYWKLCLVDTSDMETGAFLAILNKFAATPYILGGNGRIGFGDIKIEIITTKTIDSNVDFKNDDFVTYIENYQANKKDVSNYFEAGVVNELFN